MKKMTEKEDLQKKLSHLLHKDLYSIKDLLKLGLFGGKSTLHREIQMGRLKAFYSSDRRLMILKEDLMDYLRSQNEKNIIDH